MPPLDMDTVLGWRGRTVRDQDGEAIGALGDIYLDGESDLPAWGTEPSPNAGFPRWRTR